MKTVFSDADKKRIGMFKVPGMRIYYDLIDSWEYHIRRGKRKIGLERYKILIEYFYRVIYNYLLEGNIVKLPYRMGYLFIYKTEVKLENMGNRDVDKKLTKKYKKMIYNLRPETGGYKPVLAHIKTKKGYKYGKMYQLKFYPRKTTDLERRFKNKEVDFPAFNNRKEVMDYVRNFELYEH